MGVIKKSSQRLLIWFGAAKRMNRQHWSIAVVGILLSVGVLTHLSGQVEATSSWIQSNWSGGIGTGTTATFSSSSNIDYSSGALTLAAPEKLLNTSFETNLSGWSTDDTGVVPGVVQKNTLASFTGTSFSVNLGAIQENNTLVAVFSSQSNPGTITLNGWTLDASITNTSSNDRTSVYRKTAGASESKTVTLGTQNSVSGTITVYELTGVDTVNPVDQTSSMQSAATTGQVVSIPTTSTTTQTNEIAIAAASFSSSSTYGSWSNGFIGASSTTSNGFSAALELTSKQTVSTSFTTGSTGRKYQGLIVTYKGVTTNQSPNAMAAVRQNSLITSGGNVTTLTGSFSQAPKSGNTLFAIHYTSGNSFQGVLTAPSGWTRVVQGLNPAGSGSALYMKTAGANEPSNVTFSWGNSVVGTIVLYEVRGLVGTNSLDQLVNVAETTANPLLINTSTLSQASEFAFGVVSTRSCGGIASTGWFEAGFVSALPSSGYCNMGNYYQALNSNQALNLSLTNTGLNTGYLATFKAGVSYAAATRDTQTIHGGSGGGVKLVSSAWVDKGRFTQSIDVGNTQTQSVVAYAKTDGSAITSDIAELYYDGAAIPTTYTDAGDGWYRLSGTTSGVAQNKKYGVEIAPDKTVYVDDFSVRSYLSPGVLTSNIYDLGYGGAWGNLTYTTTGNGTVTVKVRSSNNADMSGATAFASCPGISSGSSLSGTACMTDNHRYVQYQVTLASATGQESPTLTNISIGYTHYDVTAPSSNASAIVMKKGPTGATVASNGWTNSAAPYFSWTAGADNVGGEGIAGYCLYLGTSDTGNPVSTKGMLGTSPLNSNGACQFAVSGTSIDLATSGYLQTALATSDSPYYLNIKAFDSAGNVIASNASFHFRFDNTTPSNPSFVSAPSQFVSNKQVTITWPNTGDGSPADSNSGIAGLQYRIGSSGTWYGDSHNGAQDTTDLLTNDGSYQTIPTPDYANINDGNNTIYFRTWDTAGNVSPAYVTAVLKVNTNGSPSAPQNVNATPTTNTQNSFAFSWLAPASFVGSASSLTYCYTINTVPTEQTCTFTAAGATSLSAGAYATQPGQNTFYIVAKDESGSINYATAASTNFTANTSAPGMPLSLDVADISVKASSNWRLAINWEAPTDLGAGVSTYQIYRSTDNITFAKTGSTGGTSYTDTGLNQVDYYYKIRACDSANNCGAFTSVVSKKPTGKFTTPPSLTAAINQPYVENITTTHATIGWSTDRACDSKVAFGTVSGTYQATEAYSATPTTNHSIQINNLSPGTTYYFKAKWTDEDGNTGSSQEVSFKTSPPPIVQDVSTSGITLSTGTVNFTTINANSIKLYYGKSNAFGGAVTLNTALAKSEYSVPLKDLDDGSKYYYKINSLDTDNHEYEGTTLSFNTPAAPKISNLRFQPIETEPSSTQKVTWTTNVPADSRLAYGVIGGAGLSLADAKMVTEHEMIVRDLEDDKQYSLIAYSRSATGDLATSDKQVFQTALDTRPPKISDITVEPTVRGSGAEARGQIIVSWTTDEPATSQVAYNSGLATDVFNSRTGEDSALTTNHVVVVSDLPTSAIYQLQAVSNDKAGNTGKSGGQSTIIGHASDNVLSIIFTALQNIFGFLR